MTTPDPSRWDPLTFRPARAGDEEGIVAAVRGGFEPDFLSQTIYGCSGISRFVARRLHADPPRDADYTVVEHQGRILGCAEVRRVPDAVLLGYLAVAPELRGSGIGSRLLTATLEPYRDSTHTLSLDVFEDNLRALGWYQRLGMETMSRSSWWVVPLDGEGQDPGRVDILRKPEADAFHNEFGFSEIELHLETCVYTVGRLGNEWFRVTQLPALASGEVRQALHWLDPARRILAILPDETLPDTLVERSIHQATARRMTGSLVTALDRLHGLEPTLR